MKIHTPSKTQQRQMLKEFITWVQQQPPHKTYDFLSYHSPCPLTQFLCWLGGTEIHVGGFKYRFITPDQHFVSNYIPTKIRDSLSYGPSDGRRSFGGLLRHLLAK